MTSSLSSGISVGNQNVSRSGLVVFSSVPLFQRVGSVEAEKRKVFSDIEEGHRPPSL